jgi:anti-sigma B factor antagonist
MEQIMRIIERRVHEAVILDLAGHLCGGSSAEVVKEALCRQAKAGAHTVVVNLAQVQSANMVGFGGLVDGYCALRNAGGELRLAALSDKICDPVVAARILAVFSTFESVEQAIEGPIPGRPDRAAPDGPLSLGVILRSLLGR